jgi:hypothetical protein
MANSPLNNFISKVKLDGLARNNRFLVCISPNSPWQQGPTTWLQDALLLCDQVQLPGTNFNTADLRTYGEIRKTPYERLYDDVNMSFYVDTSMTVKLLFDNWMMAIQDPGTRNFNYYDQYISNITIEVQDLKNQSRYAVQLREAYPKSIGAIQLDQSNKDVMKLSVNFAYKYYVVGKEITVENTDRVEDGGFGVYNFQGDSPSTNDPVFSGNTEVPPGSVPRSYTPDFGTAGSNYLIPPYDGRYTPIFNQTPSARRIQNDPLNSFINRLKNFAIGAVGAKVVSSIPGLLRR